MFPLTSKLFHTYKCSYADLLSSAVTTRYHRLRRVCERSIPPTSNTNSSWLSTTFPCSLATSGHRKRPFSSRFAHTHSPLPCQNSNFCRFRWPLDHTKSCPLSASPTTLSRTSPYSPPKPLRKSAAPSARYTRVAGPNPNTHACPNTRTSCCSTFGSTP